jgi:hypothetical protein
LSPNRSYNKTKKSALEVLEDRTWMDVPAFARKVGIRPVRRTYTYLAHLEDLGLVTSRLRKKADSGVTQETQGSSFYTCEAMTNNRAEYSATFRRSDVSRRIIR